MISRMKPLNVVWICFEDTSPRFGCCGNAAARTPHVDRLAAEGCSYDNTFCTAPVCAPARSAVYSGVYATFAGAHHMRVTHTNPHVPEQKAYTCVPPPYVKFFTETFRQHGWFCTNYGKSDTQFESHFDLAPFTAWDLQGWGSEEAPVHWRRRTPGQPFFSVFNFPSTHEGRMWPKEGESVRTDPAAVVLPPYLPDTPENRLAYARAHDQLEEVDAQAGRVLRELEEDGLADATVMMVWSDHGEGLPRSKRWLYDSGLRVPLIVRWPGQMAPGTRDGRLISTIDLAPTVLAMAGLPAPVHLQGVPFWGPEAREREHVFATRDRYDEAFDMVRCVRGRRHKLIRNYHPELPGTVWTPYSYRHPIQRDLDARWAAGTGGGGQLARERREPVELYDLEADPWEMENLAGRGELAGVQAELSVELERWQAEYDRFRDVPETEMVARMWPGGTRPVTHAPRLIPHGPHHDGLAPLADGAVLRGPVLLEWHCFSQGASIGYRWRDDAPGQWRLAGPRLRLEPGRHEITFKAMRMGYAESPETLLSFEVV